jgi:hypothetical protein
MSGWLMRASITVLGKSVRLQTELHYLYDILDLIHYKGIDKPLLSESEFMMLESLYYEVHKKAGYLFLRRYKNEKVMHSFSRSIDDNFLYSMDNAREIIRKLRAVINQRHIHSKLPFLGIREIEKKYSNRLSEMTNRYEYVFSVMKKKA